MRDVGLLVWVVLLIVGVGASMVSSIRRAAQAPRGPASPAQAVRQPSPPPGRASTMAQAPQAAQPSPAPLLPPRRPQPPVRPAPRAADHPIAEHTPVARRFFAGSADLRRAVVAAEVLGKPRALRDEYFPY